MKHPEFARSRSARPARYGVRGRSFALSSGRAWIARAFLFFALVCAACGTRGSDTVSRARESADEASVTGTVLDAASGEPIAGAKIRGPHDARAVSGRDGRFELRGLRAGDRGEVVATLADGTTVEQKLRPLAPGALEVVLHVSRR